MASACQSGANGSDTSPPREEERRTSAECKPLLALATPGMFKANSFRITGLSVDATTREITRRSDKLKMMEEFGEGKSAHTGAFALNPPPTIDQIREAIQRLKEPEARIIDEFFWFWPRQSNQSEFDPAIKALENGDSETALKIWSLLETSPSEGVIAMHNTAVLWLLTALEWESYAAATGDLTEEQMLELEKFWLRSTDRWDLLVGDDLFWEGVKARIKNLDDARLTTGFARRMRATLPIALDKINAELALKYAESGRRDRAEFHVNYLRRKNQPDGAMEQIAEMVLAPATARLKQQIDGTRQRAAQVPGDAVVAGKELLKYAESTIALYRLFLEKENNLGKEIADDIATLCNRMQVEYYKATGNNEACLELLRMALPFAFSDDLRLQIEKNIATVKSNLAYKELEPILATLNQIEESKDTPKAKLIKLKREILPLLETLVRTQGRNGNTASELANAVAINLRSVSIDAHNNHNDMVTGMEAIAIANGLALDPEIKRRLEQDIAQITRNKNEAEQRNLLLDIRDDKIEVTREKFRYNSHIIPSNEVTGVRFGVFTQYTNGVKSSVSYKVAVQSASHGVADVECKRFFRSEDKAKADFNAIINALYYQIIPSLVSRLAKAILADNGVPLGDCSMMKNGIHLKTGALFWKEEHMISWLDVRFGSGGGYLSISSAQNPKLKKTFGLRDAWNAVIFKEIADAVVTLLNK